MTRTPEFPVDAQFPARWSGRGMTGQALDADTLHTLLEAMRWSPSSMNAQPWRVAWGLAGTPAFARLLDVLVPFNRAWCEKAGALLALASLRHFPTGEANRWSAFDAGAAWMSLALQGSRLGLVVHALGGYEHERALQELQVPAELELHALIAVGYPGSREVLPQNLQEREQPNERRPVAAFATEGGFIL